MTLLQISEKIRDHLIAQKAKSMHGEAKCLYRSDSGNMCAVGCIIPDELYDTTLETQSMRTNAVTEVVNKALRLRLDRSSIDCLQLWQNYHDSYHTEYDLRTKFRAGYGKWLEDGAIPGDPNSPEVMFEYLKADPRFDMTGEITRRYVKQVSGFIADHLLKQGKQAVDSVKSCRYRADDGCMCAVGVLIDKELYSVDLEGVSLSSERVRVTVAKSLGIKTSDITWGSPMFVMLRSWQRYHDEQTSTFTNVEISAHIHEIDLLLDDTKKFPNLKD